jgi:hypothetical protein
MSLAAASHAPALCRPVVSGTSRARPVGACACERGRNDASGVASVAPASTVRLARGRRGRTSTTVTRAAVGDPNWFANQALAAGVILAGFVATGGLEELGLGSGSDGGEDGPDEPCSMCEGTGRTECQCTRWSDDGEGCSSCGYTGVSICPACRGGGRAVRVTLEIPVETEEQIREQVKRQNEQQFVNGAASGFKLPGLVYHSTTLEPDSLPRSVGAAATDGHLQKSEESGENKSQDDPSSSKDDDFYAQSGEAIRTLREDYPALLDKQLTWGIYRDDIGLVDNTGEWHDRGHVVASGIGEYKRTHKWLRTAASILFSQVECNVVRIWSPLGSSGVRAIKVRWSITAKLRLVGNLTEDCHFDGISEYKLDRAGFIYQHSFTDLDWDVAQMKDRIAALSFGQMRQREPQLGSGQWFKDLVPEGWWR